MDKWIKAQERAEEIFNSGFNCCEAVVRAVAEYFGEDLDTATKIATPFGSGMSKNGSTCGALSGAFICCGLMHGRKASDESRDPSYVPADNIFNKFKEKYGSSCCIDITGVDFRNPDEVTKNKERIHNELCGPLVKQVVFWVLEELDK